MRSGILDRFDNYFEPVIPFQNLSLYMREDFDLESKRPSCVPKSLFNRLTSYQSEWDGHYFVDTLTKERLTFSFTSNYDEDLLIHEQCGGGFGLPALSYFRFKTSVRKEINNRLRHLPKNYMAVHVRNSDVTSDYKLFFHSIKHIIEGKNLLICTDGFDVLTYARTFFDNANIISVYDIPFTNGESLHSNPLVTDWNVNIGCLTDLMALGMASVIILPSKQVGYPSGFAQLGCSIMQDCFFVHQLMGKIKGQELIFNFLANLGTHWQYFENERPIQSADLNHTQDIDSG